jgi:hypothetical protein
LGVGERDEEGTHIPEPDARRFTLELGATLGAIGCHSQTRPDVSAETQRPQVLTE